MSLFRGFLQSMPTGRLKKGIEGLDEEENRSR
jgi:hypothetical protein